MKREFTITMKGHEIRVKHESWEYVEHLEFFSKMTSETGYRSYFFYKEQTEGMSLEEFAKKVAEHLSKSVNFEVNSLSRWLNCGA